LKRATGERVSSINEEAQLAPVSVASLD
jgi:hypothetical protein